MNTEYLNQLRCQSNRSTKTVTIGQREVLFFRNFMFLTTINQCIHLEDNYKLNLRKIQY